MIRRRQRGFGLIDFLDEESPLKYPRAQAKVQRLSLRDTDATKIPDGYFPYFKTAMVHTTGGKKRLPGASAGVVAFLDYHRQPDGGIYIDYITVRSDQRLKKHACTLIDKLYERHANVPYIDFGEVLHAAIGKLCLRKREAGRPTRWEW